jgi:hypothetical protein
MASLPDMPDDSDKIQFPPPPLPAVWDTARSELARDVDRVADRLRGLSQARLAAAAPPHASRGAAARVTAQLLADACAGLEAGLNHVTPTWREVPELSDFAAGDQLAVTGHDLVAAAELVAPDDLAWARGGRRTAHELLAAAADALATLRRLL